MLRRYLEALWLLLEFSCNTFLVPDMINCEFLSLIHLFASIENDEDLVDADLKLEPGNTLKLC